MKSLKFRNIFFAPGERGKAKIVETTKGVEALVGREDLKEIIKNNPELTFEIPLIEEKGQER